jgi:anti-sigma-K factor RskA
MGESINIQALIDSGTLELYVAGSLPPEEAEEVNRLASIHPDVHAEIVAIEQAMFAYAGAQSTRIPKEATLEAAMDRIGKETLPPRQEPRTRPLTPGASIKPLPRWSTAIAASLFLASIALNIYFFVRWQETNDQLAQIQQTNTTLAESQVQLTRQVDEATDLLAILTQPATQKITLNGIPGKSPQSSATVVWNPETQQALLQQAALPAPPAGKQYQMWAIIDGQPVDAGVFAYGEAWQSLKSITGTPAAFAVTLEPTGGSPSPTPEEMYVLGEV